MKGSIIATYSGFGTLPLAIKLLLLTSENFSFDARTSPEDPLATGSEANVQFSLSKPKPRLALNRWSWN